VLVIVSNQFDQGAKSLASRWTAAGHVVGLLTPRDLSIAGWRCHPCGGKGHELAIIQGSVIPTESITGVFTRMASVFESDLTGIVAQDRSYVAAEMTAMLLSWLWGLRCPVVNRPTATCLAGPYWSTERWLKAARDLHIPTQPFQRSVHTRASHAEEPLPARSVIVTVIGEHVFGDEDGVPALWARRLAKAAECDLLTLTFEESGSSYAFAGAHLWPDLGDPVLADALVAHVQGRAQASAHGAAQ